MEPEPDDPGAAGHWMRAERTRRDMTATELAKRLSEMASRQGTVTKVSQQVVSRFEIGDTKRKPHWVRYAAPVFQAFDRGGYPNEDSTTDAGVLIRTLPTHVGLGGGGTGDGNDNWLAFSRHLIQVELRIPPRHLLAMVAEGNSMEPDFRGGDLILVDTRRTALAQPGAFCLWDGDGHVIKYIEKVPGTDPVKVRLISANGIYEPAERLADEIGLIGRVVWYARRVL